MESLWLSVSILLKESQPYSCILRQLKQCKEVHEQQQIISFGSCTIVASWFNKKCSRNIASRFQGIELMVSPDEFTHC